MSPRHLRCACFTLITAEAIGCALMWAAIPIAWMWIGARVYAATGSLMADLTIAFGGFLATTWLTMLTLGRIDRRWIELRQRNGHNQRDGALSRVVIVSSTFGLLAFAVWWYFLGGLRHGHFVIPFLPTN